MKYPYTIKMIISYQAIAFPISYIYCVICCTIIKAEIRVIINDVNIIIFSVHLPLERDATFECQFDFGFVKMQLQKFFTH